MVLDCQLWLPWADRKEMKVIVVYYYFVMILICNLNLV